MSHYHLDFSISAWKCTNPIHPPLLNNDNNNKHLHSVHATALRLHKRIRKQSELSCMFRSNPFAENCSKETKKSPFQPLIFSA